MRTSNRRSSDDSRRVMHPNSRAPKVHHNHNSVPLKIPLQNTELIKMITKKQEEILKMVTATTTQKILGKSSTARIADGHVTPTILGIHPRQALFFRLLLQKRKIKSQSRYCKIQISSGKVENSKGGAATEVLSSL